jgi:hypothetical protein
MGVGTSYTERRERTKGSLAMMTATQTTTQTYPKTLAEARIALRNAFDDAAVVSVNTYLQLADGSLYAIRMMRDGTVYEGHQTF